MHTKLGDYCFSRFRYMTAGVENGSCDPDHATFRGILSPESYGLDTVYLYAKFDDFSFSRSRDIIGAPKFKMGHVTVIKPLLRVICPPYAGT